MLGCCGAIADWAGRTEIYEQTKAFLDSELSKLGDPIVIAGCPTCAKQLRGHEGVSVVGVWDILTQIGLPEGAKGLDRPAALHDACGARGDQETQSAIRTLLEQLGCTLREPEDAGDRAPCCGYGGLAAYANPEVAGELTEQCLARRGTVDHLLHGLPRPLRQSGAGIAPFAGAGLRHGRRGPAGHQRKTIQPPRAQARAAAGILERGDRRHGTGIQSRLHAGGARDDGRAHDPHGGRGARAPRHARDGRGRARQESGLTIARARIGNTTFWVGFTETGADAYLVHRAYSHRMQVERRNG